MILKLLLLAAVGVFVYKLFGGTLPSIKKPSVKAKKSSGRTKEETKRLDENTLVECVKCGTYVTIKESIVIHGKYYCDECAHA